MTINSTVFISIILPVYNGEKYLRESIESILNQTYRNFEFIIINDGSTDSSDSIIKTYQDSRIRYFSQSNLGLAKTLNRGICLSRYLYIARQDQDDVSYANRLKDQLNFLVDNMDVDMVGSWANIKVEATDTNRTMKHPITDSALKLSLLFDNYFIHSSVMIRKEVLDLLGGYSEDIEKQPPEDYELWSRMMKSGSKFSNISNFLIGYREVPTSMSRTLKKPISRNVILISESNVAWAIGRDQNLKQISLLVKLMHADYSFTKTPNLYLITITLKRAISGILHHCNARAFSNLDLIIYLYLKLYFRYLDFFFGGLLEKLIRSVLKRSNFLR